MSTKKKNLLRTQWGVGALLAEIFRSTEACREKLKDSLDNAGRPQSLPALHGLVVACFGELILRFDPEYPVDAFIRVCAEPDGYIGPDGLTRKQVLVEMAKEYESVDDVCQKMDSGELTHAQALVEVGNMCKKSGLEAYFGPAFTVPKDVASEPPKKLN